MGQEPQPSWVVTEFVAAYLDDQVESRVRTLEEYLEAFPGDPDGVAREYETLRTPGPGTGGETIPTTWTRGFEGRRLGRYELLSELGRGGQGRVYLAREEDLGREVAIKLLSVHPGAESTRELKRLEREAAIVQKLRHPAIGEIFAIGREADQAYLVLRYVEGAPLSDGLGSGSADGTPPLELLGTGLPDAEAIARIVRFFEQTARALDAAHEQGVIHRDVKPSNIMVTPDQTPVILDFGMARDTQGEMPEVTLTGDLFGTPSYMSPEQLTAHRVPLDARTDVYSLGVALYESLTRQRPFEAPTRADLYQAILSKDPVDPRSRNPSISAALAAVVQCALEKDRDRRYRTAGEMAEDLRRAGRLEPVLAKLPSPWLRTRRVYQRHPGVAWSLTALFVVLAVGLAIVSDLLVKARDAESEQARRVTELEGVARNLRRGVETASFGSGSRKDLELSTLRQALERLNALADVRGDDPDYMREVARTHRSLGTVLGKGQIGSDPEGRDIVHLRKSLAVHQRLAERPGATIADRIAMAQSHRQLGVALELRRQYDEAAAEADRAVTIVEAIAEDRPDEKRVLQMTMLAYEARATIHRRKRENAEAKKLLTRAFEIAERLLAASPEELQHMENYLTVAQHLGAVRLAMRDLEGLEEQTWRQHAVGLEYVSRAPGNANAHMILGVQQILLGNLHIVAKEQDDAVEHFFAANRSLRRAVAIEPDRLIYRERLRDAVRTESSLRFHLKQRVQAYILGIEWQWVWAMRPGVDPTEGLKIAQVCLSTREPAARRPDLAVQLIHQLLGRADTAEETYIVDARLTLADAYLRLHAPGRARQEFDRVQPLLDGMPDALKRRAEGLERQFQRLVDDGELDPRGS